MWYMVCGHENFSYKSYFEADERLALLKNATTFMICQSDETDSDFSVVASRRR